MSTTKGTALEAAMRILAGRAHGRDELTKKLEARGFDAATIKEAIERAEALHLMPSESALAERFAEELAKKKGATPDGVHQRLLARGFAEEVTRAAVGTAFAEWDPLAAARRCIAGEVDPKRAARRLQQRGFSADVIARVVRNLEPQE